MITRFEPTLWNDCFVPPPGIQVECAEDFMWLYAMPCISETAHMGGHRLTPLERRAADVYIRHRRIPPQAVVRRWLPGPFKWFAQRNRMVSTESMKDYWRIEHRDSAQISPTEVAEITVPALADPTLCEAEVLPALQGPEEHRRTVQLINYWGYPLIRGDRVMIHMRVIAEVRTPFTI